MELAAAMSGQGKLDIRLEAAMAKLWHSEKCWDLVNEAVQVRGGRGYETADSLRARGEDPVPLERCLRDSRINLIFEGTSEIMRLFMAREAVDHHLAVAGNVIDERLAAGKRVAALLKAGLHYVIWYPGRWLGWGRWPRYAEFGELARHMRYADRKSRKLARAIFHAMLRFGPKLEQRQALLGRFVDIGADLFVISASCVRAMKLLRDAPGERSPIELADAACALARRRIDARFRAVLQNDDSQMYRVARNAMADRYEWLEEGLCD